MAVKEKETINLDREARNETALKEEARQSLPPVW